MNVLIVDDNANNRLILRLMLDEYQESNDIDLDIEEAEDGQIAIDMCKENIFDIVFMDIMMPNVDGIEATKVIRDSNDKVMIIAVSAVDDTERMKIILNNGAEDYITKPVNSDLFMNRINNYFNIIKSRSHVIENKNFHNLYSSKVYNRYTKFMINSDDSLAEFWECFLLNNGEKFDNLSNVVRTVFSIAEARQKLSDRTEIYIEESDDYQYFTIMDIGVLPEKVIELVIKKAGVKLEYKIDDNKLTFKLEKIITISAVEESVLVQENINTSIPEKEVSQASINEYKKPQEVLTVYDYIDEDDMVDLEEYASKLNSLMLVVGSGYISEEEVEEMYTYLDRLGQILSTYSEIYPISVALSSLSSAMQNNTSVFMEKSEFIGPLCKAFSNDMSTWIQMSFHDGAPSVDFMNDTIAVNTQTISSMLTMDDSASGEEDLDDIFDF